MAIDTDGVLTLGVVKDYLNLTDHSPILERIVDGVSAEIERFLHRKIRSQSYSELYPRPCENVITLKQPDVTEIKGIFLDTFDAFRAIHSVAATDTVARIQVTAAAVKTFTRQGATETVDTFDFVDDPGNYPSLAHLQSAVSGVNGWEAELLNNGPAAYLVPMGAQDALNRWVTLQSWEDYDGEYSVDYNTGEIRLDRWSMAHFSDIPWVRVDYTAGHENVPSDVIRVALEMVQDAWNRRSSDNTVQSESEGDYSVTYRIPDLNGNQAWMRALTAHKRYTV